MNKKPLTIIMALLLIVLLISVVACGKKQEAGTGDQTGTATEKPVPTKTLKIGFIMPMSGAASLWGNLIKQDTDAYAAVVNDDGGLKIGDEYYKIEPFYADDEGLPDNALVAARQLVENKGVTALLGYWNFGLSSIASMTTPGKIITVFNNTTGYDPKTMPYAAFSTDAVRVAFPQFQAILKHFPDMKTMGLSGDEIYIGSLTPAENLIKETLAEKGIGFYIDTYPWGTLDYTQHLEKLKKAGVDVMYSSASPENEAMKQKQIFEMNLNMNFAGAGTIPDLKSYIDIAGYEAAQGGLHPYDFPWDLKETKVAPDVVQISERIRDKHYELYKEEISYSGAFPYGLDSMLMYFEALQRADTIDPDEVMKVIDGGTFDLFNGTYTLGGKETFGRAVVAPSSGTMGKVEGYKNVLAVETPAYERP